MILGNSLYYFDMEFDDISISLKEHLTILGVHLESVFFQIAYKCVAKKYTLRQDKSY